MELKYCLKTGTVCFVGKCADHGLEFQTFTKFKWKRIIRLIMKKREHFWHYYRPTEV